MLIQKNVTFMGIMAFAGHHLIWLTAWAALVAGLYQFTPVRDFNIPWLPLSVIGTAVAFYVGFKNNQAYDRLWEARKIWGAIVNNSRTWGTTVKHFVSNQFRNEKMTADELQQFKIRLVHRHIAWLYALRSQLLIPTEWEHVNLRGQFGVFARKRRQKFGVGLFEDDNTVDNLTKYLPGPELETVTNFKNTATQIIDRQAEDLAKLRALDLIDDLKHVEMQRILGDFYNSQGMAERIKKFPLPRQYGSLSFLFVCLFIFMLPFGMITEFEKLGTWGVWFSVPFIVIIGWVYVVMELIGDYSENPFEGLYNDIPMLSICRTIEIDLLEMHGQPDIPKPVAPQSGILM